MGSVKIDWEIQDKPKTRHRGHSLARIWPTLDGKWDFQNRTSRFWTPLWVQILWLWKAVAGAPDQKLLCFTHLWSNWIIESNCGNCSKSIVEQLNDHKIMPTGHKILEHLNIRTYVCHVDKSKFDADSEVSDYRIKSIRAFTSGFIPEFPCSPVHFTIHEFTIREFSPVRQFASSSENQKLEVKQRDK